MNINVTNLTVESVTGLGDEKVACSNCQACCCRLEVMLISDTGVPMKHIDNDRWGAQVMARLEDGWCSALDRNTFLCTIYNNRPWICREFEMGSYECISERSTAANKSRIKNG